MIGLIVAVGVLAAIAAAIWFAKHTKHPEQTAGHHDDVRADSTDQRFHRTDDRPAGPDAEDVVGPADPRDPARPNEPPA